MVTWPEFEIVAAIEIIDGETVVADGAESCASA
jgi:hypothetical protein